MKDVTETNLLARVNRALANEGKRMKVCGEQEEWFSENGRYYVIDTQHNRIEAQHCDLIGWAQDLEVLYAGERLTE